MKAAVAVLTPCWTRAERAGHKGPRGAGREGLPSDPPRGNDNLLSRRLRATCVGMADRATKRRPEGVTVRHGRSCPAREGGRCTCRPAHQAQVFSPRDRRTIRKSFPSLTEARAWRADTKAALAKGTLRAPTRTTLRACFEIEDARR